MDGGDVFGWLVLLAILAIVGALCWWQWQAYVTLDQKIERSDESLLHDSATKVETILDAPAGSVIVPYVPAQMVPVQHQQQPAAQVYQPPQM
jgi:cytoskeletal protein RodZ